MSTEYEYRGMVARAWDLLRGDTSDWEDRSYHLAVLREFGEPALDVGCGTGRLLLDYLQQGIDIDGVDNSPEMLALLREKAAALGLEPRVWQQPMEDLDLPRRYQTIIVPSSSFQLVIDPDAAARTMRRFHDHLLPSGALEMPFIAMGRPTYDNDERWTTEQVRPEDGATIRRHAHARFDPETDLEHTEDEYEVVVDGKVVYSEHHERSPATRNYSVEAARALFETAGFRIDRLTYAFSDEPYDPARHPYFAIVGIRAP